MFDMLFEGKVALITASTSGIGLKTAEMIARGAAHAVIVNGRDTQAGRRAANALSRIAPQVTVLFEQADINKSAELASLYARIGHQFGKLDILVHCCIGNAPFQPFSDLTTAEIQEGIDNLLGGLMLSCRFALPLLHKAGGGAIVTVASDAARVPTPGESVIGGAFAGAVMFSKVLASEEGRNGVRVNVVTPSLVRETRSYDHVMRQPFARKIFEKAAARATLGLPAPENVAPVIAFLASPLASHITGQVVSVNGGISFA